LTNGFRYYPTIRSSFIYKLFVSCLVTLFAIYAHRFLPLKTLQVVPAHDVQANLYSEDNSAGVPMASWLNSDKLIWQCNIEDNGKSHGCGANIVLAKEATGTGVDLSGYDRVNIDLEYSGDATLFRFFTRNFVEGFSKKDDLNSARFSNALIPVQYINSDLSISFSEFFVAEWWVNTYQVPRQYMRTDFNHTNVFGIDLSYPTPPGIHRFHLKKLEFVGLWVSKEEWHLGILIFWISAIFILGGYNLWQLKRQHLAERLRLDSLISQNSVLESETNHYKQLSRLDQLTGLLNRHGLTYYIDKNFSEEQYRQVSLIIIDIDFFKRINDSYGHSGGDMVLQKIALALRDNVRNNDYSARWGGEEFAIVLPSTTLDEARTIAEHLRSLVASMQFEEFPDLQVTISVGVGAIDGIEPFHMLFRRVDIALYQAKAQGRNRVVVV